MRFFLRGLWMAKVFFLFSFSLVTAKTLRVGLAGEASSLDPHFHNVVPNMNLSAHFFDRLIHRDKRLKLIPGLALSWKSINPTTWVFDLRKNVKWHDGSEFTAADVVFTIRRIPLVLNSPSSFRPFVKQLVGYRAINKHQVELKTKVPFPLMPEYMCSFFIVSKAAAERFVKQNPKLVKDIYTIPSKFYNSGQLLVGTGPYKLKKWISGDRIILQKSGVYWGQKSHWNTVIVRTISNGSSRIAALLSGEVDIINQVPTADVKNLDRDKRIDLAQISSDSLIYLHLDSGRDSSPYVTDISGKKMKKNPLKDVRVRLAISKAINRKVIAERVMQGLAVPSGQLMPGGAFGFTKNLEPRAFDPEGAKKLLKEAGYPRGFGLTIHAPNNRYVNDAKVAQVIAQFLTRVGIKMKVETMPKNIYFSKATKLEFSFMLLGWRSDTGEPSSTMKTLIHTYDRENAMGTSNRGRFSDKKFDTMLKKALRVIDAKKREDLLRKGIEYVIGERLAVIPIHFQIHNWALRKGFRYEPRVDGYTFANFVR